MEYENKIALVVKKDLLNWQKLNVASFLGSSIAIKFPETHGEPFVNASESEYLPFLKHPILIYKAESQSEIDRVFSRAKERELHLGIYTNALFATKNENENHVEIGKYTDENHELAGIIIYGQKKKGGQGFERTQVS